ncbi:MAG: hypothetical protein HQK79_00340 [Desulfobacterales bacterium]|nr:hypothetical protein [Desulfobacterales bacterium]
MTIGMKLSGVCGMILVLFLIVSGIGIWEMHSVDKKYRIDAMEEVAMKEETAKIEPLVWEIRSHARDFYLKLDLKYSEKTLQTIEKAYQKAEELLKKSNSTQGKNKLVDMQNQLKELKELFKKLVQQYETIGLNDMTGLQGKIVEDSRALEAQFKKYNNEKIDTSKLEITYLTMRRAEKNYILRKETTYLDILHKLQETFKKQLEEIPIPENGKIVILDMLTKYVKGFDEVVKTMEERAITFKLAVEVGDKILSLAEETVKIEEDDTKNAISNISSDAKGAITVLWIISIFGIIIAVALTLVIIKNINSLLKRLTLNLSNASSQLTLASNEIAKSAQEVAAGASEQAASLEETSSAMEEMASQTKENADSANSVAVSVSSVASMVKHSSENAKVTSNLAKEASLAAESGVKAMGEIALSMKEIRDGSDKITDIIEVINEITHQTKMLATNAAIEAARAGDQGKGFAVVADEVSKLAEHSKKAAKEIAVLIKDSAKKAQSGNDLAEKGETALQNIFDKAVKVSELINEISASADEQTKEISNVEQLINNIKNASVQQATGVEEMRRAIADMDKVTQGNAASAEEAASASEQLAGQSILLNDIVNEVSKNVGIHVQEKHLDEPNTKIERRAPSKVRQRTSKANKPLALAEPSKSKSNDSLGDDFKDF